MKSYKKESMQGEIVIVLGMHRSGTSMVTGILNEMGYETGETIKASKDNPKGYFENSEILALNERILNGLGYAWDSITFAEENVTSRIPYPAFIDGKELLLRLLKKHKRIVLKDPRICLLLPFWQQLIAGIPDLTHKYVFTFRHPMEVAMSELKRATTSRGYHSLGGKVDYNLRLWFIYNLEILTHLDQSSFILSFSELIEEPGRVLNPLPEFLDIEMDNAKVEEIYTQFIDSSLYRNKTELYQQSKDKPQNAFIWSLYDTLVRLNEKDIISVSDANTAIKAFSFMQHVHNFNYAIKEMPKIVKSHIS